MYCRRRGLNAILIISYLNSITNIRYKVISRLCCKLDEHNSLTSQNKCIIYFVVLLQSQEGISRASVLSRDTMVFALRLCCVLPVCVCFNRTCNVFLYDYQSVHITVITGSVSLQVDYAFAATCRL